MSSSYRKLMTIFAIALVATTIRATHAQSTWNTTTGNWNVAGNWDTGIVPVSGTTTQLVFGGASTYTATNDITGTFTLNKLTISDTGSATIAGNALSFGGTSAGITVSAGSGAATISDAITYAATATVTNSSSNLLTLSGAQTYNANTTYTGSGSITSAGLQTFATGTTVSYSGTGILALGKASGSSIALAGTVNISNTSTGTLTLADGGTYSGSSVTLNLSNSGGGTFNIGNMSGVSGTLNINAGTVKFAGSTGGDLFGSSITLNVASGATFDFAGNGETMGAISGTGTITGANITMQTTGNKTWGGVISGTGTFSTGASGVNYTFTGANTSTGTTTIVAGSSLTIGNGGATGSVASNTIANAGSLIFNRSDAGLTVANALTGAGTVTQAGAGTTTFTTAKTYTGGTIINKGTLALAFNGLSTPTNLLASTGTLTLGGGTLQATAKSNTASSQTLAGTTLTAATQSFVVATGNGTGVMTIDLGAITQNTNAAADFNLGTSQVVKTKTANTGNSIFGGWATVNNGSDWAVSAGDGTTSGNISARASSSSDTWGFGVDTNIVSSHTASDTITNSLRFTAAAGANVTLAGDTTISSGGIAIPATVTGNSSINAGTLAATSNTLYVQQYSAGSLEIGSTIAGTTALVKMGTGTGSIILSGENTFSGDTTLLNGTLQLGNGDSTGSVTSNVVAANTANVIFNRTTDWSYGGILSGPLALTKSNSNNLTLTNTNTQTGAVTINGGTLTVGNGGRLSGNAAVTVNTGAALSINSSTALTTASTIGLNGGTLQITGPYSTGSAQRVITFGVAGGTIDVAAGVTMGTTGNTFAGSGTFTKTGEGLINTGSNASTLTGNVVINNGTIQFNSSQFQSVSGMTVNAGGQYEIKDDATATFRIATGAMVNLNGNGPVSSSNPGAIILTDQSGTSLTAGGPITTFSNAITLQSDSLIGVYNGSSAVRTSKLTLSGAIIGTHNLSKTGGGVLVLSNAGNTYSGSTGTTAVLNGTLQISGGTNRLPVATTLVLGDATTNTSGAFDLNGLDQTVAGLTTAGVGSNNAVFTSAVGTPTFTVSQPTGTQTYGGSLGGLGTNNNNFNFTKSGAGILTLAGNNTMTGTMTVDTGTLIVAGTNATTTPINLVNGGALQIGNGGTFGSISADVTGAGTLSFARSDDHTFSGVIGGTVSVIKTGSNTVTLTGTSTTIGSTTVQAGTLRVTANTVARPYTVQDGGALSFTNPNPAASFAMSTLTVGSVGTAGLAFDFTNGFTSTGQSLVDVAGVDGLSLNGSVSVTVTKSGGFATGQYPLIKYAGNLQGAGFSALALNSSALPFRVTGNLVNNTANSTIDVNVVADFIRWNGGVVGANWNTTDSNWKLNSSGALTTYTEGFSGTDAPVFNDLAATYTVNILSLVQPNSVSVNNSTSDYTFQGAGAIGGATGLTKQGTAKLILANDNTFTGATVINDGTVQLGNGGATGSIQSNVSGSGTLEFNRGSDLTFANMISGGIAIVKNGSNTVTLTGTNTQASNVSVNAGILSIASQTNLGSNTPVAFNGGTLQITGNYSTPTVTQVFTVNSAGGTIEVADTFFAIKQTDSLNGSGALLKTGGGTLSIEGNTASVYSGAITVNSGSVRVTGIGLAGADNLTVNNGGALWLHDTTSVTALTPLALASGKTLTLNGNGNQQTGAFRHTLDEAGSATANINVPIILGSNARLTFENRAADTVTDTFNQPISGTGGLIKDGNGTMIIAAASTYGGNTVVSYGTLKIAGGSDRMPVGTILQMGEAGSGNSGTFDLNGQSQLVGGLTSAGTGTANRVTTSATGSPTLTVNVGSGTQTFGGILGGTGTNNNAFNVTKAGSGTLTLTGTNTFTGTFNINEGIVSIGAQANLGGNTASIVFNGGTLHATGNVSSAANQIFTFNSGGGTIDVETGLTYGKYGSAITGSGAMIKTGAGVLGITNTGGTAFTGPINVNGGALRFTSLRLSNADTMTIGSGGTLWLDDTTSFNSSTQFVITAGKSLILNGDGQSYTAPNGIPYQGAFLHTLDEAGSATAGINVPITLASNSRFTLSQTANFSTRTLTDTMVDTFNQPISGPGGLIKDGDGTMVIAANATYAGTTVVSNGTLKIAGSNNRLPVSTTLQMGEATSSFGGTFDLNGLNQTLAGLTSAGGGAANSAVVNTSTTAAVLTVDQPSGSLTYAGSLGAGTNTNFSFVKNGVGSLRLDYNSTYTGSTTVVGGTLVVGNATALSGNSKQINVDSGAVLDVSPAGGYTFDPSQTLKVGRSGGAATDFVGDATIQGTLDVGGINAARTATFANNVTLSDATIKFDLNTTNAVGGGTNDLINVQGNLTLNGTSGVQFNKLGPTLAAGSYTLMTYSGSLTGSASNLSPAGLPAGTTRQTFAFDTTTTPQSVLLNVTGQAANLAWGGDLNNNVWDVINTANWTGGNTFPSGSVDNRFYQLDAVLFGDTGVGGVTPVVVNDVVQPISVTFTGSQDYRLVGPGFVGGPASLTQNGTGTVTIETANTYTGDTVVNSGTLVFGTGGSNIGALKVNGGTVTGSTGAVVGSVVVAGGTVNGHASGAFTGPFSITSGTVNGDAGGAFSGTFTVDGGTVYATVASAFSGNFTINGGLVTAATGVSNALTGNFILNGGTLSVASDTSLPTTAAITMNGGTFQIRGAYNSAANQVLTFNSSGGTIDVLTGVTAVKHGTGFVGSGKLIKTGGGVLSVQSGGGAGFTGDIDVNDGTLAFTSLRFSNAGNVVINSGGTVWLDDTTSFNATTQFVIGSGKTLTLNGNGYNNGGAFRHTLGESGSADAGINIPITLATNARFTQVNRAPADITVDTFNQPISGTGSLIKDGDGKMYLAATATYTGATIITNGVLGIKGAANRLPASTTLQFGETGSANSGTFDLSGQDQTVAALATAGTGTAHQIVNNGTGTPTFTANVASGTQSFPGIIGGTGSGTGLKFRKDGAGTLTLSGSSTYSGNTIISNGTLQFATGSNRLPTISTVQLGETASANSGVLDLNGQNQTVAGLIVAGPGTDHRVISSSGGNGTLTVNVTAGSSTFAGVLGGLGVNDNSFHLTKTGSGTFALSNTNTFTGNTTVSAGTLALTGNGSIDNSNTIRIAVGTTLDVTNRNDGTLAILSGQTLLVAGAVQGALYAVPGANVGAGTSIGTATINGDATFDGTNLLFELGSTTTPGAGVNDLISVNGNLTVAGSLNNVIHVIPSPAIATGTYRLFDYTGTLAGDHTNFSVVGARGTYVVDTSTAGQVNLQVTPAPAATLTWVGGAGGNSWDLATTANWHDGAAASIFYDLDNVNFTDAGLAHANLVLTGTLSPGNINVSNSTGTYTFSGTGQIVGLSNLTKSGNGNLVLANAGGNLSTGTTTIAGGTVTMGISNGLPTGALTVDGATAALDIGASSNSVGIITIDNGSSIAGTTGVLTSSGTVEAKAGAISAIISTPGGINKTTSGTVTLSSSSTFGSTVSVAGGTLNVTGATSIGGGINVSAGTINVSGGGTIQGGLTMTGGTASFSVPTTLSGGIQITGGAATFSESLSLTGSITVSGGSLVLAKANTMAGSTTITLSGGSLESQAVGAVAGGVTAIALSNNGTFKASSVNQSYSLPLTVGTGGGTIEVAGPDLSRTMTATNLTVGANTLTKTGDGTLIVSGTAFAGVTGTIDVQGGRVRTNATGDLLGNNTTLNIGAGAIFDDSYGNGEDFGVLTGAGAFIEHVGTAIRPGLQTGSVDATFSGRLTGGTNVPDAPLVAPVFDQAGADSRNVGFTWGGNGVMRLTGADSDFSGAVTVSGGTLSFNNITDRGLAATNRSALGMGNVATGNTGADIRLSGSVDTTLQYTGASAATNRTIALTGTGLRNLEVTQAGTTLTLNGVINGTSSLLKTGPGTINSTAANTYSGDTTVAAGALQTVSLTNNANTIVASGATLNVGNVTQTSVTNDGTINLGAGSISTTDTVDGTGSLSLGNNATLTASHVRQTGTLTVQGDSSNTSAKVTINASGAGPAGDVAAVSRVGTLTINNNNAVIGAAPFTAAVRSYYGTLDLKNNDLIIDNTDVATLTDVGDMIRSGMGDLVTPTWSGTGITSSYAADTGNNTYVGATGLGSMRNVVNPLLPSGPSNGPAITSFDGQTLTGGETLVKFTWLGDFDLDGQITSMDFALLDAGFAGTKQADGLPGWFLGDADYNGVVDTQDYALLNAGYTAYSGAAPNNQLPEPSSLLLGLAGVTGLWVAARRIRNASK